MRDGRIRVVGGLGDRCRRIDRRMRISVELAAFVRGDHRQFGATSIRMSRGLDRVRACMAKHQVPTLVLGAGVCGRRALAAGTMTREKVRRWNVMSPRISTEVVPKSTKTCLLSMHE